MIGTRDNYLLPKPLQGLARLPRTKILALAVILSVGLGAVDWLTGPLFSFTIFYVVPVALAAWLLGRRDAIVISFFCAAVWTIADAESWPTRLPPVLDAWNAFVRLGFFLLVTWLLATTRRAVEAQNALARRIQAGLLTSRVPVDGPVEVAASWRPAQAVSGDFYLVDKDTDDGVIACIADVSGKGVGPALLMANVHAALEAIVGTGTPPGEICARLNRFVARHATAERYVTFFVARLDASGGRLSYCNAGHNPPVLLRAGGAVETLKGGGPVLGVFDDRAFTETEIAVGGGDRLILYTDGVSEAWNPAGEEFGERRIVSAAAGAEWVGAEETQHRILDALEAFTKGAYHDDVTTVVLALRPLDVP